MVTPELMLELPVKAAWPPLLTANSHWVSFRIVKAVETFWADLGDTRHVGSVVACWTDQYRDSS